MAAVGQTIDGTITLSAPAPASGTQVNLSSSNAGVAAVAPASITIAQGETSAAYTVTGVALGTATITGSSSGFTSGTVGITVTSNAITVGPVTMGPGGTQGFPVTLSQAAPAGGLTVTLASNNPSVVTVVPGSVFIPAGASFANPNPIATAQGLGTTTITATASGYAPGIATAKVALTGTLTPSPFSVAQSTTSNVTLTLSQVAPAGGLTIDLSTDNVGIATVPASLTIAQGNLSGQVAVTGVAPGTTTLHARGAGLTETTATVNVTPAPAINVGSLANLGKDLQRPFSLSLGEPAPAGNLTVTLTSADPSKVLLSTGATTAGSASIAVTFSAGNSGSSTTVYAQSLANSGTVQVTASAPGYANGSGSVSLVPSGFYFISGNITTTTLSSDDLVRVCSASLNAATLNVAQQDELRGGIASVGVAVSSSNTAVGTLVNSPDGIPGGQGCTYQTAPEMMFHPVGAGTATLTVVAPSGFSTPSNNQSITATVN